MCQIPLRALLVRGPRHIHGPERPGHVSQDVLLPKTSLRAVQCRDAGLDSRKGKKKPACSRPANRSTKLIHRLTHRQQNHANSPVRGYKEHDNINIDLELTSATKLTGSTW